MARSGHREVRPTVAGRRGREDHTIREWVDVRGRRVVLGLEPEAVWLWHTHEPWRPPGR